MACAQFDRFHRGTDTGVSRQHDNTDGGFHIDQGTTHIEAGFNANAQIHDGQVGMEFFRRLYGLVLTVGMVNLLLVEYE